MIHTKLPTIQNPLVLLSAFCKRYIIYAPIITCIIAYPSFAFTYNQNELNTLAKITLNNIQADSFANKSEYCGYFLINKKGELVASRAVKGNMFSCKIDDDPEDGDIIASYHSHGHFNPSIDSEIPSSYDLIDDLFNNRNGYVSTPGGRLWFINSKEGYVELICGVDCLKQDKRYYATIDDPLENKYLLEELYMREKTHNSNFIDL